MNKKIGLYIFLFLGVASCGKKEDVKVAISVDFSKTFAIDAKGTSCSARYDYVLALANCAKSGTCTTSPTQTTGDLAAPYASFGNMTMTWTGEGYFELIYMKFKLKSNLFTTGTYNYTYGDKEMWVAWRYARYSAGVIYYDPPGNPYLFYDQTAATDAETPAGPITTDYRDSFIPAAITRVKNTRNKSDCDLFIPGLPVDTKKRNQSGLISGQAFIYGIQTKSDGTKVPVTAYSQTITIEWIPLD